MTDEELKTIRKAAADFRRAIVFSNLAEMPIAFRQFPRGSSGDAALLLGTYLSELGLGNFTYVCGWRDESSHGWITKDDVTIDIAADSFHEDQPPIMVVRNSTWHSEFEIETNQSHVAHVDAVDGPIMPELRRAYRQLVDWIAEHPV